MPIKKPISEHNEWAFIIRPNIILYDTISNDFAEKLVLKIKEKLCKERHFGVLKTLKTRSFRGLCPLDPCRGVAPEPHQGPLRRPLDPVKMLCSLRSLCSNWTQTIFIQHPAVTNPAHAHVFEWSFAFLEWIFGRVKFRRVQFPLFYIQRVKFLEGS